MSLFDELNNIKIVDDNDDKYYIFRDNFHYPNITFETTKEFKNLYEKLKNKYITHDPYKDNPKLIDFYSGLEDIMQKYGYTILDKIGLQDTLTLPPTATLEKILEEEPNLYSRKGRGRKLKDIINSDDVFTSEENKQKFTNAYNALIDAINYIKSYPDYDSDNNTAVDDLLYFEYSKPLFFNTEHFIVQTIANSDMRIYVTQDKEVTYDNNDSRKDEFLALEREIGELIKLKFNEISKMYLQNLKTLISRLDDTYVKNIYSNQITIQPKTKLSDEDTNIVAETMIKYL